jgi:hypothetical protein
MLVRNPQLEGRVVQLRKSQNKFDSDDCTLDIVKGSNYCQGFLNK